MKKAFAFVAVVAGVILILSARVFDTGTVLFIGATMLIVAFFAASTVVLGVISRRAGVKRPDHLDESDGAEVIGDDEPSA